MPGMETNIDGFEDLMKQINQIGASVSGDQILDIIEAGTDQYLADLLRLPKPISQIRKGGYTHLVDSFAAKREDGVIKVGWGKYYGRFVEKGTRKMSAQPHLVPLWEQNQARYVGEMRDAFWNKIK